MPPGAHKEKDTPDPKNRLSFATDPKNCSFSLLTKESRLGSGCSFGLPELIEQLAVRDDLRGSHGVAHRVDQERERVLQELFGRLRRLVTLLDQRHGYKLIRELHLRLKSAGFIVPRVFVRMVAKGRNGTKEPRPIQAFTKAWKAACAAAGCPGRIPHDLRRTAIRNGVRRGLAERVSMQLAGHKTRSVFDRYNIVSDGDLRGAAAKLQGLTGTEKGQSGSLSAAAESESPRIAK